MDQPTQEVDLAEQIVQAILSLTPEEQESILSKLEAAVGWEVAAKEEAKEEVKEEMKENAPSEQEKADYAAKLAM